MKDSSRRSFTVRVLSPGKSSHVDNRFGYLKRLGHLASMTRLPGKGRNTMVKLSNTMKLMREVLTSKADVYHAHFAISDVAILAMVFGKKPLLVSTMGADVLLDEQGDPTRVMKYIAATVLSNADAVTAKSQYNANVIEKLTRNKCKPEILVWGVDLQVFTLLPEPQLESAAFLPAGEKSLSCKQWEQNGTQRPIVILQPRGLSCVYNTGLLLRACKRLKQKGCQFKLVLCNSVAAAESIEVWQQVQTLGLRECVLGLEHVDQQQLNVWYNKADLVVSIASSDGLPMTVIESLAVNTPVLVGRLPHLKQEFSDREVIWTELNEDAVAFNIEQFITKKQQGYRYTSGRDYVEKNFNLDTDLKRYQSIMESIHSSPRKVSVLVRFSLLICYLLNHATLFLTQILGRKMMSWAYIRNS